jgi:alpha-L-fucosidase
LDIVSRGGNYLLSVPPKADGTFPNLIVERLMQMGKWLKLNGESIYETRPYIKPYQWSGDTDYEIDYGKSMAFDTGGFDITEYTNSKIKEHPLIEAFFTKKPNVLYVILPNWPREKFILKDFITSADIKVTMLGLKVNLNWKKESNNLIIDIPKLDPDKLPCNYAYTLKLENIDTNDK